MSIFKKAARSFAVLFCLVCLLVPWIGPAGALQSVTLEEMVERLRDRSIPSVAIDRRNEILEELRRSRTTGITRDLRRRALEWAMLQPTIDLQIPFNSNKADLSPQAYPVLQRLMAALPKASPRSEFLIIGHTDSVGSDDYNQTLSENRALKVVEFLVNSSNISPHRLHSYGFGSLFPLTPATPDAAVNRRVQIVNIGEPPNFVTTLLPRMRFGAMLMDTRVLSLLLALFMTSFAVRYWIATRTLNAGIAHNDGRIARIDQLFGDIGQSLQKFGGGAQRKVELLSGSVGNLSQAALEVRREAHDVETHACKLESKATAAQAKVQTVKTRIEAEVGELRRIGAEVKGALGNIERNTRLIDQLEHEVHTVETLRRMARQVMFKVNGVGFELKRIAAQVRNQHNGAEHTPLSIDHVTNGHAGSKEEYRRRAITELTAADRRIEKLMDDTIQTEAGYQTIFGSQFVRNELALEVEEHHRKLIDTAQSIFRDVRAFLAPASVQVMEALNEQIDWCRGELFANPSSMEAAKTYHAEVKDYSIKLKEAINKSLHAIVEA